MTSTVTHGGPKTSINNSFCPADALTNVDFAVADVVVVVVVVD